MNSPHSDAPQPLVIDPTGTDIHGESDRIRARGPATRVELPGGVFVAVVTSNVDEPAAVIDAGVKTAPAPAGNPPTLKFTTPENPFSAPIVTA